MRDTTEYVDVTPDFAQMRKAFFTPHAITAAFTNFLMTLSPSQLRTLNAHVLYPLNMAAQCSTSTAELVEIRDLLGTLQKVAFDTSFDRNREEDDADTVCPMGETACDVCGAHDPTNLGGPHHDEGCIHFTG